MHVLLPSKRSMLEVIYQLNITPYCLHKRYNCLFIGQPFQGAHPFTTAQPLGAICSVCLNLHLLLEIYLVWPPIFPSNM